MLVKSRSHALRNPAESVVRTADLHGSVRVRCGYGPARGRSAIPQHQRGHVIIEIGESQRILAGIVEKFTWDPTGEFERLTEG
jgi:hypothetical protein